MKKVELTNNRVLEIFQDDCAPNPRKEFDNVGTMICFHRRYNLGDEDHGFDTPEDVQEYLSENPDVIALPLYLMDHSGVSMSVKPFGCPWDSGQVGVIIVTPEKLKSECIKREKAIGILTGEVKTYNQYLTGDVYGFMLQEITKCDCCGESKLEVIDSCCGFFGFDLENICYQAELSEEETKLVLEA